MIKKHQFTPTQQLIIKFLKQNKGQAFNQNKLSEQLNIHPRYIRRDISAINCDRSHKTIILSNNEGYWIPNRITDKLIREQSLRLSKSARKQFYRANSMRKKFNLPDLTLEDFQDLDATNA